MTADDLRGRRRLTGHLGNLGPIVPILARGAVRDDRDHDSAWCRLARLCPGLPPGPGARIPHGQSGGGDRAASARRGFTSAAPERLSWCRCGPSSTTRWSWPGQAVRGRAVYRRNARRSGDAHESAGARSGDHREWAVGLDDEISASRPDEAALAGVRWSDPAVLLLLRRGMCGFTHPG